MAERKTWYKLDNAAKIIPSSVEGADTRVFRLVCELREEVDPELLQRALDRTLIEFPYMNSCMRRGIFWYYLDASKERARVTEENVPALSSLYRPGYKSLLFRVSYYKKRVNLEMFHVLADGTGGFVFFTHLLTHYLAQKRGLDAEALLPDDSTIAEKEADAFRHYYEGRRERKEKNRIRIRHNYIREMFPTRAHQIHGEVDEDLRQHLLEGIVSSEKLVEAAHRYDVTVGVFITAVYVESILSQMTVRDKRRPIIVSVPVNLRQYFPSATTRNFYGAIQVAYDPSQYNGTLKSVIGEIRDAFAENLQEEKLHATMNSYASLEHNYAIKMTPLFLKYPAIFTFNHAMKKGITTSVSNLGMITLAKELEGEIDHFAAFMASRTAFLCVSSFKDRTVFGMTSCFTKHHVFMHFFRKLTELGLDVELSTNDFDREES